MTSTRAACQPAWLDAFWNDQLGSQELEQFEHHLSVCELCQSRFDEYMNSQQVMETLGDSRDALCTSIVVNRPSHSDQDQEQQEQLENLRVLAKRLFPASGSADDKQKAAKDSHEKLANDGRFGEVLGTIDHFDLLEPIGSGGMGFVYKSYDKRLHRLVAIKILSPSVATTGAAKQRFMREAQAAANITSSHVVPIHAVSQCDGLPYLVMSLIDGTDLQRWILENGPLSILDSLRIARQVAAGLHAAHEKGVVHRDVKPANVLLQPSIMQALLTDFGLAMVADEASLTHSGMTPGTPSYMSPEQACGETIDHRSDWYSFGCVLYTMLVGHPPFRGPHAMAILSRLQSENAKLPSDVRSEIPPWLDRLVLRLLEKNVDLRIAEGEKIIGLLDDCIAHLENPKQNPVPIELFISRKNRYRRWLPAISAVLALTCITGLLLFAVFREDATVKRLPPANKSSNAVSPSAESSELSNISPSTPVERDIIEAEVLLKLGEFEYRDAEQNMEIEYLDKAIFELESQP